MKKIRILSVVFLALVCFFCFNVVAEVIDSGACGENLTWALDDEGVLTISGSGDMEDLSDWNGNKTNIKKIIIKSGVTSIGISAFNGCNSLESMLIPDSVTSIGLNAFFDDNLEDIWYGGTQTGWDMLGEYKPNGTLHIIAASGTGTQTDPYIIKSTDHWDTLAKCLADGVFVSTGKHFRLVEDIGVSTMLGDSDYPFSGTFDGNGKTLTFTADVSKKYCAPFRCVGAATIQSLSVTGTICTSAKFAAGFVAYVDRSCAITNCVSSVSIDSRLSGDGTHGGFIALCAENCEVTITGCVFNGQLLGRRTTMSGGFVGYTSMDKVTIQDSLLAAQKFEWTGSQNFVRNGGNTDLILKNCYHLGVTANHSEQGLRAYTVSADEDITVIYDSGKTYTVSGITACETGLLYNDAFRAGKGQQISLTLSGGDLAGTVTEYGSDAGTLIPSGNDYKLTMPASDVRIMARHIVEDVSYTGGTEDCELVLPERCSWPSGWYVVRDDTFMQGRVNISGDVNLILMDGETLTAEKGIHVPESSSLTIWAQEKGTGALNVSGPDDNEAGIGGNNGERCGKVTVNGGMLSVKPGSYAAGIGGGNRGGAGTIIINDGSVTVNPFGERQSSGIGTGRAQAGDGGSVTITGGKVDAEGQVGAGIGGGSQSNGIDVTITGGTVIARSKLGGAGIGGGSYGNGGYVTITGGYVTAIGAPYGGARSAAGIGAGRSRNEATVGNSGTVIIAGGTVIAKGGVDTTEGSGHRFANAIGTSSEVKDTGVLALRDMAVKTSEGQKTPAPFDKRREICRGTEVYIYPCDSDLFSASADLFVMQCAYCGKPGEAGEGHTDDFTLPAELKTIAPKAFEGLTIRAVDIPDGCTTIGAGAFADCNSLVQIRIPKTVKTIEDGAFTKQTRILLIGPKDSAAKAYAQENPNCEFVEETE